MLVSRVSSFRRAEKFLQIIHTNSDYNHSNYHQSRYISTPSFIRLFSSGHKHGKKKDPPPQTPHPKDQKDHPQPIQHVDHQHQPAQHKDHKQPVHPPSPPSPPSATSPAATQKPQQQPLVLSTLSWNFKKQLGILMGAQFINTLSFSVIIPLLPLFASELGLGPSGIGMIISAPAVARVFLNIPMGALADKYGRKVMLVTGVLMTSLGTLGTGVGSTVATLLPFRLLVGTGTAANQAGSQALIADLTSEHPALRGRLVGIAHTTANLALTAGPAIGGLMAEAYGYKSAFYVMACGSLLSAFAYLGLNPDNRPKPPVSNEVRPPFIERFRTSRKEWVELLKDPAQQAIIAGYLCQFSGISALMCVLPLHATAVWGAGSADLGAFFAGISAIGFVGAPLGGWLADKIGRSKTILGASSLIVLGSLGVAQCWDFYSFAAPLALWGLGNSLLNPALAVFVMDSAPAAHRGRALSISRTAGDMAFIVAPMALGQFAEIMGCPLALNLTTALYVVAFTFFGVRVGLRR